MFQISTTAMPEFLRRLMAWGLVDAVLPFLLIFILVFAILQKVNVFEKRGINGALAFIIAGMVVVPHVLRYYPEGQDPITIMLGFLPTTMALLVAIIGVMLLLGLSGAGVPNAIVWFVALGALGILGFTILMSVMPGLFPSFEFLRDPGLQAVLIILIMIGLVGYFVFREGGSGPDDPHAWMQPWFSAPKRRNPPQGGGGGTGN